MRLLDTEQLEYAFQLHGITREVQARAFYGEIWSLIQDAEKIRDQSVLTACQGSLRNACQSYFGIMREWRLAEDRGDGDACAQSLANAEEAAVLLAIFEKQFFRYALCYLELNRALIHVRGRVHAFAKDYNIDDPALLRDIGAATGTLLSRAHRERAGLVEKRLRLGRMRDALTGFDPLMDHIQDGLLAHFGQARGDSQMTAFKAALRTSRFARARTIAGTWKHAGLQQKAQQLTDMAAANEAIIAAQGSLMLHTGELALMTGFLKGEEAHINCLIDKYNIPYMVYQYRNLLHQGYLLGRIGSLEGLIICHAKLLSLAARVHDDPVLAQAQEQTVLNPARHLAQSRFPTLGAIFNTMETTLAVLEKLFETTSAYHAQTQGEQGKNPLPF